MLKYSSFTFKLCNLDLIPEEKCNKILLIYHKIFIMKLIQQR